MRPRALSRLERVLRDAPTDGTLGQQLAISLAGRYGAMSVDAAVGVLTDTIRRLHEADDRVSALLAARGVVRSPAAMNGAREAQRTKRQRKSRAKPGAVRGGTPDAELLRCVRAYRAENPDATCGQAWRELDQPRAYTAFKRTYWGRTEP